MDNTVTRPTAVRRPPGTNYPLAFAVDYPDRFDRVSTAFRLILAIPILILVGVLVGTLNDDQLTATYAVEPYFRVTMPDVLAVAGLLVLPPLLMIVFRRKYPRWWFDWNLQLLRLHNRVSAYLLLLRGEYPSTDEDQAVHLDMPYPDASRLSRWMPLAKWLLAIPHYLVLAVLNLMAVLTTVVAWFAILLTGRYPRGLFDFVVGVLRWNNRVIAYAFILATDVYPPFRLSP
jgi:hypothetical protein